jgi:hypothetical protein
MRTPLFFLLLLSITLLNAQTTTTLEGTVVDGKTGEPVPFANVFLDNTTLGAASDQNGEFVIRNVFYPAHYDIVISFVGYKTYRAKVPIQPDKNKLGIIRLTPDETALNEVEVKAKRDASWERNFRRFKRFFLGNNSAAQMCNILNPWVVEVKKGKWLTATATEPIEIENLWLGYKILFFLRNFSANDSSYVIQGNAQFQEMTATNPEQANRWQENREASYRHSTAFLFKSILESKIKGNGFSLFVGLPSMEESMIRAQTFSENINQRLRKMDTTNLLIPSLQGNIYRINLGKLVEVHYSRERTSQRFYRDVPFPVSWVRTNKGIVFVNQQGYELNPEDVTVSGDLNNGKISSLLPLNYQSLDQPVAIGKKEYLFEKVYLHCDKPYYYPGDPMWIKGYMSYFLPEMADSLSKTVRVELLRRTSQASGYIVFSKQQRIVNGEFGCQFFLPDSLKPGSYYLRAYTNMMRNFSTNHPVDLKRVPVLNPNENLSRQYEKHAASSDSALYIHCSATPKVEELVEFSLMLRDETGAPSSGSFSVSITNEDMVVPTFFDSTILVGTKIPNKIFSPASITYPVEWGISFSGRLTDQKKRGRRSGISVVAPSHGLQTITQSNERGFFQLKGFVFYDTATFLFQPLQEVQKKQPQYRVELEAQPPMPVKFQQNERQLNVEKIDTLKTKDQRPNIIDNNKLLSEIVVTSKQETEPELDRPYGKPDYVVPKKELDAAYGNLLMFLPGKVPGLIVREANMPAQPARWVVYTVKGEASSIFNKREVLVMVNNNMVTGTPADILSRIDPATVETIEVKTGLTALNGSFGGSGVLAVYLRNDDGLPQLSKNKKIPSATVVGYQTSQPFNFGLQYNNKPVTTIYWNPNLKIDQSGHATFAAFIPKKGKYRVVVEGVSAELMPVRTEYSFSAD